MKFLISITIIFILFITIGCDTLYKNKCENQFLFIKSEGIAPVLNIDLFNTPEKVRQDLNNLCQVDLCDSCKLINFNYPITIFNQKDFINIKIDFDSPYCKKCPPANRMRYLSSILINRNNQILFEYNPASIDSLSELLLEDLNEIKLSGDMDHAKRLIYSIHYHPLSSQETLDHVLKVIAKSHLEFVKTELNQNSIDFCSLSHQDIDQLKLKNPLNIEFSYPTRESVAPWPRNYSDSLKFQNSP